MAGSGSLCIAFGFPLRGVRSLVYLYPLLYPSLCNSPTGGLSVDAKSVT